MKLTPCVESQQFSKDILFKLFLKADELREENGKDIDKNINTEK